MCKLELSFYSSLEQVTPFNSLVIMLMLLVLHLANKDSILHIVRVKRIMRTSVCTSLWPDVVADRRVRLRRHHCRLNVHRREPQCALQCAHGVREQVDGSCDVVDEARRRGLLRVAADRAERVVDAPHAEARGVEVVRLLADGAVDFLLFDLLFFGRCICRDSTLRASSEPPGRTLDLSSK